MVSWYKNLRNAFLQDSIDRIISQLHESAANEGWHIEPDQDEEWRASLAIMKEALEDRSLFFIEGVLMEYDFRRRGIRIDFILLAPGALYVIEFKRGSLTAADRDQVMNYCVNLVEFHELTQGACPKIFPVLVSRQGVRLLTLPEVRWHQDWPQICSSVMCTTHSDLGTVLIRLQDHVQPNGSTFSLENWDASPFHPSSTIVDAAISLYGQHDVSAIRSHAAPKADIDRCIQSVIKEIEAATRANRHELIIVSGAPGAGKTLVGLAIAFHENYRGEAVFVTGNAPLVDVLNGSLQRSYVRLRRQGRSRALGGYSRSGIPFVERNSDFKIVKAHRFLENVRRRRPAQNGSGTQSTDGRILIFDEAQRTYAAGTQVNRQRLEDDEAVMIIDEASDRPGSIIILLIGHNQHINSAEMGALAWLEAARKKHWPFAISEKSLVLEEFAKAPEWTDDPLRIRIEGTHLSHSMRDQRTRNGEIERWADLVMSNKPGKAAEIADSLPRMSRIVITRSLQTAKNWARQRQTGEDRIGLIASGQGRRLRSEGIFVGEKPDIVHWMLAPNDDVRSSNMLEQTQNQYQIQGLEIDYAIVCWDADFRREPKEWVCYNISGAGWTRSSGEDETRSNSYRVLLTRSRKGMVIFVPVGDRSGVDRTRNPRFYDGINDYLIECGASEI